MNMTAVCDKCHGTGKLIKFFCKSCKGSGKQHKNRDIVIKIPIGIRPEQTIRLEGIGNRDEGIPGDLLVTLRLRSTPYKILGDDLIGEIKIDCFEAMMGCEKQISTLDGEKKISIPAGIQPFKKIRLANLGYPRSLNSRARGNFLIEVKVFIPKIEDLDTVNLLNKVRGL